MGEGAGRCPMGLAHRAVLSRSSSRALHLALALLA